MFTIPRGSVAKAGLLLVLVPFASQGEVVIASGQVFMSPANVTNFHSMEARIVGATGDVYHATSFGETLVWQCDGCADGAYGVEVRTTAEVGVSETGEGPKPLLRVEAIEHQRFVVQGGWVTPAALRSDSGESGIEAPSILSRVARAVLDAVLPAAQAVDLTASSVFPSVFFDDTFIDASPSNNFRLICLASTGNTSNICEFQDLGLGSRPMFNFTSNTSSLRMGVGTPVPATALHIATPQSPMILLDSPGTDFLFGLDDSNDDVAFGFSSNASGPVGTILTLENDLNSTIYPGVGIWKVNPRAALHVGSHDHMSAQLRVENNLAPTKAGDAVMLQLTNPGKKAVGLRINAGGSFW